MQKWLDDETKQADAIGEKYKHLLGDTDDIETYNGLAELANIKGMNPKDVVDTLIQNELDECKDTDWKEFEVTEKVELVAQ